MAFTKSSKVFVFFIFLLILVAFLGVSVEGTVHQVGDSTGWTMMGVNYETWASSKTFQVGDSLVFKYNNEYHDVSQVTHDDFELCDPSNPITRYETGLDTITLTKPGIQYFMCGTPGHCSVGQKIQVHVMPASLGPVAAPVPVPVRSPSSSSSSPAPSSLADSPINNAPQYHMGSSPAPVEVHMGPSPAPVEVHMGPSPAPVSAASSSVVSIGFCCFLLGLLFVLV